MAKGTVSPGGPDRWERWRMSGQLLSGTLFAGVRKQKTLRHAWVALLLTMVQASQPVVNFFTSYEPRVYPDACAVSSPTAFVLNVSQTAPTVFAAGVPLPFQLCSACLGSSHIQLPVTPLRFLVILYGAFAAYLMVALFYNTMALHRLPLHAARYKVFLYDIRSRGWFVALFTTIFITVAGCILTVLYRMSQTSLGVVTERTCPNALYNWTTNTTFEPVLFNMTFGFTRGKNPTEGYVEDPSKLPAWQLGLTVAIMWFTSYGSALLAAWGQSKDAYAGTTITKVIQKPSELGELGLVRWKVDADNVFKEMDKLSEQLRKVGWLGRDNRPAPEALDAAKTAVKVNRAWWTSVQMVEYCIMFPDDMDCFVDALSGIKFYEMIFYRLQLNGKVLPNAGQDITTDAGDERYKAGDYPPHIQRFNSWLNDADKTGRYMEYPYRPAP